jgi:hypothetical protein
MTIKPLIASLIALATFGHAAPASKQPTWTDPEVAAREDADFTVQGEYRSAGETSPVGAQVVAQGDGTFSVYLLEGGLPGAGWKPGQPRILLQAERKDGGISGTLVGGGPAVVLQAGKIIVTKADGTKLELSRVERQSPTLGEKPPQGAVVLFDGSSADAWEKGKMENGLLQATSCFSKEHFSDFRLHVEFRTPYKPHARSQQRGNSGIYVNGRWETQILDSFGLEGMENECGGVYSVARPLLNMCLPPLSWQTYDIEFTAARFDAAGQRTSWPRMTVKLNGVVVHEQIELRKDCTAAAPISTPLDKAAGPVFLQDHGNPVMFRNIWVLPKK